NSAINSSSQLVASAVAAAIAADGAASALWCTLMQRTTQTCSDCCALLLSPLPGFSVLQSNLHDEKRGIDSPSLGSSCLHLHHRTILLPACLADWQLSAVAVAFCLSRSFSFPVIVGIIPPSIPSSSNNICLI